MSILCPCLSFVCLSFVPVYTLSLSILCPSILCLSILCLSILCLSILCLSILCLSILWGGTILQWGKNIPPNFNDEGTALQTHMLMFFWIKYARKCDQHCATLLWKILWLFYIHVYIFTTKLFCEQAKLSFMYKPRYPLLLYCLDLTQKYT
jgi:hypothetical protein